MTDITPRIDYRLDPFVKYMRKDDAERIAELNQRDDPCWRYEVRERRVFGTVAYTVMVIDEDGYEVGEL